MGVLIEGAFVKKVPSPAEGNFDGVLTVFNGR